ncbi:MAG: NADH:flavin oxidoreductase [Desulfovibrio sp.]|jgi:2,4-dienoyl-CoA reductase-like NADH-dependent reductase (Old Yellow Enzyme family)|nr:NADH:flavin oxidoreductase [Desulfovibrio sp.]
MNASIIFSPVSFGKLVLKNRLVRSATWEGMATEEGGLITDTLLGLVEGLAKGGCGLIITSHAYVCRDGQASRRQMGAWGEVCRPGLARLASTAHAHSTPIALQINHGGLLSDASPPDLPRLGPSAVNSIEALGATGVVGGGTELGKAEIASLCRAFATAAGMAKDAGFDAVQMHCAHSYLLSQFLCPHVNRRTDEYGGSIANRARFPLEALRAVRGAVGEDYPLLVKINCSDFIPDGITLEDAVEVCSMMDEAGVDGIEISGGSRFGPRIPYPAGKTPMGDNEGYYRDAAELYKTRVGTPLILVGGFRSPAGVSGVLERGLADAVSFSRPFIREPDFPARWQAGELTALACVSCNICAKKARIHGNIHCAAGQPK